jgi:plastocyanin
VPLLAKHLGLSAIGSRGMEEGANSARPSSPHRGKSLARRLLRVLRSQPKEMKMSRKAILGLSMLLIASNAGAEPLTGKIEDPAIRRKAQLVYVEKVESKVTPPSQPAVVTQRGNVYLPHVLPIVAGTTVVFKSEDPELHNVYARGEKRVLFNDAVLPKMQSPPKTFTEPGAVHLTCNIHREMSAWVVVLQNAYFAVPKQDGTFTISGLPAGRYTVRVWGEELTEEQKAKTYAFTVAGGVL